MFLYNKIQFSFLTYNPIKKWRHKVSSESKRFGVTKSCKHKFISIFQKQESAYCF